MPDDRTGPYRRSTVSTRTAGRCSVTDPRVELLVYEFIAVDKRHDYSQATVWQGDLGGFDCRLDGGKLEARPTDHYVDSASARQALEVHLHAWELWSELE